MALPFRPAATATTPIDIPAWSRSTLSFLPSTRALSSSLADDPLEIPLDQATAKSLTQERREARVLKARIVAEQAGYIFEDGDPRMGEISEYVRKGSEIRRRDSLKRREALLKGKEGSRRRQKWENDRLLGNPAFQPPEPHDFAPRPTHTVSHTPYVLAPLWDSHYAAASSLRAQERKRKVAEGAAKAMPKELKEKLKRARGARTLLIQLEEEVRAFVCDWEEGTRFKEMGWEAVSKELDTDGEVSSEEEVVFVGRRNGSAKTKFRREEKDVSGERLVFHSLVEDQDGSFGRWLVHSIANYYDLKTWSVTTGDPARREAYVGIPEARTKRRSSVVGSDVASGAIQLPRPLWVMV